MLAVKGFYDGRTVKLTQAVPAKHKPDVLVIFEEVELPATEKENSQAERREAFQRFMKYQGTLHRDFDYKKELMEYLDERYGNIN